MTQQSPAYLLLACIAQHRMATTAHLHALTAPDRHPNTTRRRLQALHEQHLTDHVVLARPSSQQLWYLTPAGRDLAQQLPELRDQDLPPAPAEPALAARLRAQHTVAVLRTHLAFLTDARRRGDEYGPLDWTPEVYHRLSESRSEALIPDALLRYTANHDSGRTQLRAFVEVDRATMSSERLASKLMTYSRFLDHTPSPAPAQRRTSANTAAHPTWMRHYPVFPRVLFVLTDASPTTLENRIHDLRAMAAGNPLAARLARKVPLGAAVLEDLEEQGPSAPVWTPLAGEDTTPRGWAEL
ncbi:replication-relaxation family protein [Streptacidiphilus neutrinimicus]|uniref:replication-relaxation family protein n=1 Tax=Streptacidiphilus neutrinimicus TaxID=105420 RepID=UPI0005AA712A|nr:replication-relaxation family protein [Streptacidiphilus neutrinimicus]